MKNNFFGEYEFIIDFCFKKVKNKQKEKDNYYHNIFYRSIRELNSINFFRGLLNFS
jgi:hypothetical protein